MEILRNHDGSPIFLLNSAGARLGALQALGDTVGSILAATFTIFFSVILGAVALAFVAVEFPAILDALLNSAGWVDDRITGTGLDSRYNVWVQFLIDPTQIVFLGFVIVTRIILAVIFSTGANMMGMGDR